MEIFGINIVVGMMAAGALGGMLFGYRNRGLVFPFWMPERKHSLDLGFFADCIFGAAGAIVVFIIIPLDLKDGGATAVHIAHQLKLLAVAFIGGYGGPAMMDVALSRTLKDVAERTEQVAQQTEAVKTKLDLQEKQQALDIKALEYVDIQLSDTMQPIPSEDLIAAIKLASPAALENIFQRAKETRHQAWLRKQAGNESHQLTERTVPIFQGLLASRYGANRHRYHANLGYALKDQEDPDWAKARDSLEQAITLLEETGRPMSPFYHFNWALCAIELDSRRESPRRSDPSIQKAIVAALQQGRRFWKLEHAISENERVRLWLDRNALSLEAIGITQGTNWAGKAGRARTGT